MAEKIREVAEKAIGTSGAGLKDVLVELLDAIKGAEVSDYVKVLKESPDLLMKGISKVGEGMGVLSPKDVISPIKDSTPAILDKVKEYGIEKFVSEVPEIADKFPDLIGAMDEMVKGIDAEKWTEYGKEFKDLVLGLFPVINEGLPAVRKANKDVDDVFNKIKGAKVTLGMNLIEMGWGFKAKFDGGKITLEEGLEDTDLTLLLPSASQLEMIDVAMTGNMSAAMKAFTTGKIKIKGAMMRGAALMPLFSAMGKLTKK
ncbi:MAG: hypothetical protein MASP_01501 [Candidatus Methanolliviera sp. GoM_asphalt]|nr:MAG: hypothetical protein MASP_01501 [Candidatus Methanolliviera sp. GoM_asphalt]